ncbi:MAG: sulfatase-like hydrolase/transferase [Phycisphaeraceae bacterium]
MTDLNRRDFMRWMAAVAGTSALPAFGQNLHAQDAGRPPNIVLVTADDMGLQLGCYGDAQAHTPNLDRFAQENVLFRNAYITTPGCSPSRASMLTGLYPHQNGQIGLSHLGFEMKEGIETIPARLKEAGYRTGLLGKLHVKPHRAFGFDFKYGGFDYVVDGEKTQFIDEPVDVVDHQWNEQEKTIKHMQIPERVGELTGRFVDASDDQPFFLMVNFPDPHPPYYHQIAGVPEQPKKAAEMQRMDFIPPDEPFHANAAAAYYNGVTRLDACFEQVLQQLRDRGVYDNTIVIFISDHGPNFGHRGKGTLYEAGLGVPMLARFPGQQGPVEIEQAVSALDLMPTALDAAGVSSSSDLPGQSLLRLFNDRWRPWENVVGEYNYHVPEMLKPMRSINDGRYKLIHNLFAPMYREILAEWGIEKVDDLADDAPWQRHNYLSYAQRSEFELYDLKEDPHEFENLADDPDHAETRQRMLALLRSWQQRTGDILRDERRMREMREEGRKLLSEVFDR